MTYTHTYVVLEVSAATYDEIASLLRDAGYDHVFGDDGEIDMHGLALAKEPINNHSTLPDTPDTSEPPPSSDT